ncbi:uncharacterized protein BT62DRAFT_551768 [Guyanagaster necrorhizus]|uniref:Uncharacterized protein n=1 Tax=Guyanagaster necrorhizus TaxID=856835 RepID=A0A9P8AMU8_9AGAR|nr:uncharacterized protein BT62DRAFT_551768 [Guyanagaster necrorhizus MCA 3950]KAG7441139.1 hypothetical protein BT62DRAFT_551768 [Guyanagaster necrorhizus MCA 3950]
MPSEDHHSHDPYDIPITSQVHRDYGTTEASLTERPPLQSRLTITHTQLAKHSQNASNIVAFYTGLRIIGQIVGALIYMAIALLFLAVSLGFSSIFSGIWNVTGHWILLYLSPTPSPYSEATLLSTFWFGFWGSATTTIPFWLVYIPLRACCDFACRGSLTLPFLNLVVVAAKIALECIVGVPLVGHYGVVTLKLGDAIRVAYLGVAALFLGVVGIMLMLLLATIPFITF